MVELIIGLTIREVTTIAFKSVLGSEFPDYPKTIMITPTKEISRHTDSGIPSRSLRKQQAKRAVTSGTMFELVD